MKTASVVAAVVIIAVLIVGFIPGCGGGSGDPSTTTTSMIQPTGGSAGSSAMAPSVVVPTGNTQVVTESAITAVPVLNLSLSTSLNGTGVVKATTLTKGELINTAGVRVAMATIAAGKASFPLTGVTAGHYYIRVNSLNQDLVPTRITNPAITLNQFVGTTLRTTVLGTLASPNVKMTTFTLGQSQHAVVAYTTGAAQPRYAYSILYLKTNPLQFQVRVLGKGTLLATLSAGGGPHTFATWLMGPTSHGTGGTSGCTGCHGNMSTKPATYAACNADNGWCYKCHYGPTGAGVAGMVDPTH